MTSPDLDRIRFVTRHFNELKGLSLAASGLIFLSLGAAYFGRGSVVAVLSVFGVRLLLTAGAVALAFYARSYYQRTFGKVQARCEPILLQGALTIYSPSVAPQVRDATSNSNFWLLRRMLLIGGTGLVVYLALRMISPSVDIHLPSTSARPVFTILQQLLDIFCGSLFLSVWISRGYRLSQGYYLVLGLLMLALPALGASMGFVVSVVWEHHGLIRPLELLLPAVYDMEMGQFLCGASFLLAGLLDHRQLVRVLGRPPAAELV